LREIAFRAAGEGTGYPRDLDRFDPHYLHLFFWNAAARQVAGAYRLAPTPDVLPRFGPAIEWGRSFVRTGYQKRFAPLLLLWKGMSRYVASRPECGVLFGAVSISNTYRPESRDPIVRMLEDCRDRDLARFAGGTGSISRG
jgi:putative hemolysin